MSSFFSLLFVCQSELTEFLAELTELAAVWMTLLVGVEMSFFRYRDFWIIFSVSTSSLTTNLQDVEAQKSTHRLIPGRRRSRC